jgi:glycine betaine/proline transport system substrate-binding protein
MFKTTSFFLFSFFIILGVLSGPAMGRENKEEVIIVINNWTSQIALSNILKEILVTHGVSVSLKTVKVEDQWGELARGWSDVQLEVWQGTMEDKFQKLTKSGKFIDAGSHMATTREDWWYPSYVKKLCPGLPDWKALRNCAKIFETASSKGKGRYLGGPWEKPDKARIRALGLDFIIERAKTSDGLWVALKKAVKEKKPILLFNWTPNWVGHKYKGEFVNFPKFDPKCETDPSWGISKKWKYDCGNPRSGWLKKAVSNNLSKKSKCAFSIVKKMSFTNSEIAKLAFEVNSKGLTYQSVAKEWVLRNPKKWKSWLPSFCHAKEEKH